MEPVKEQFQGCTLKCHLSEIMREARKERQKESKMMNHIHTSLGLETGVPFEGNHAKTR